MAKGKGNEWQKEREMNDKRRGKQMAKGEGTK